MSVTDAGSLSGISSIGTASAIATRATARISAACSARAVASIDRTSLAASAASEHCSATVPDARVITQDGSLTESMKNGDAAVKVASNVALPTATLEAFVTVN